jgi:regulator of sigma E protease
MIWYSLIDLISGKYGMKDISGPIGIVTAIGSSIDYEAHFRDNLLMVMNIAIFITINLGVFNLIPLPALDGGRLFFLIIEAIRRKPIDPEKEGMVHFVGLVIAILLMLVFTFNDILNIIR